MPTVNTEPPILAPVTNFPALAALTLPNNVLRMLPEPPVPPAPPNKLPNPPKPDANPPNLDINNPPPIAGIAVMAAVVAVCPPKDISLNIPLRGAVMLLKRLPISASADFLLTSYCSPWYKVWSDSYLFCNRASKLSPSAVSRLKSNLPFDLAILRASSDSC